MIKLIYPLFLSFLLVACSQQTTEMNVTTSPANSGIESQYNEAFLNVNEAQLFFKEDQSIAYFEGVGNEFASFTEKTHWLSNDIVEVTVDNGGSVIHRYFSVKDEAISLLMMTTNEEPIPSLEQLERMPLTDTIIQFPVAVGDVHNEWRVIDLAAVVETPYYTFEQAIVFEKITGNDTNRIYVVPGFGMVKNEFVSIVDDKKEHITSSLPTIDFE